MSLNLSSLKNISAKLTNNPQEKDHAETCTTKIPLLTLEKKSEVKNSAITPSEMQSGGAPKISLMKLKQASGIETSPILEKEKTNETEPVTEIMMGEEESEKNKTILSTPEQGDQEEVFSVLKQEPIPLSSGEVIITEELMSSSEKPESILTIEESLPAGKEFFPNFQVSGKFDLEEDLLSLGEPLYINKIAEPVVSEEFTLSPSPEDTQMEEIEVAPVSLEEEALSVPEEITKTEAITPLQEESLEEIVVIDVPKETLHEEIIQDVTPEYVREVKADLSEGRRAGFRFFVQKKTKIIAGVGAVLLSLSAIAFFSGSLFLSDVEKSGKSNIQERAETLQTEVVAEKPSETPLPVVAENPIVETNYEMGRDYTVTKNTKKNIRKNTTENSFSGTETPTP